MKIQMVKQPGGALIPASDIEAERMKRFKNGEMYEVELKLSRNPQFHGKMFAFFNFCFQYWCADINGYEYLDEPAQFESFRKQLTILAGFKVVTYPISGGELIIEAESLKYESMDPERFGQCYNAQIQAAMNHIFRGSNEEIYNKLHSFF